MVVIFEDSKGERRPYIPRARHEVVGLRFLHLTQSTMSLEQRFPESRKDDGIPPELILSIQRVLDIHAGPDSDPLDDLSDDFNPVGTLNGIFPNGARTRFKCLRNEDESLNRGIPWTARGCSSTPGSERARPPTGNYVVTGRVKEGTRP